MEHKFRIYPSVVSSKGQTIIPKKVREIMKLQTGDVLSFRVDEENNISLEKGVTECKICKGEKIVDEKPCPMCDGKGTMEVSVSFFQYLEKLSRCNIFVSVIHEDIKDEKRTKRKFPLVQVMSNTYSKNFLDSLHDYLQIKAITELVKDIKIGEIETSDTVTIEEVLKCLKLEENKKQFAMVVKEELDKAANPLKQIFEAFFDI